MKIKLLTNAWYPAGLPKYAEYTDALKQAYCAAAGWDYVRMEIPPPAGLPGAWAKAQAVSHALENAEAVLWCDADAAPLNVQKAAEVQTCIQAAGDRIVCAKDSNGWNCGVFSVSGPKGLGMLEDCMTLSGKYRFHPWFQQAAFMELQPQRPGLVVQPPPDLGWNKYDFPSAKEWERYRPGDFCLHLPGQPDWFRAKVFGYLCRDGN